MNKTQVDLVKDVVTKYDDSIQATSVFGYRVTFDDQSIYDSHKSFVTLDSDKELAICIRSNNDHYTNVVAPFEISTGSYDKILHMEAFVDMAHLMEAIDGLTSLSDFQKQCIEKWAKSINNTNLAPMEDRPYFKNDATIPGKFHEPTVRTDIEETDDFYKQGAFNN